MSNRSAEASRAVREAWEREHRLILEGRGTRDWNYEQQRDIIEKGRAYDENGRAFEGHHMKSVEAYPDYQQNPDNIQFLSKSEHFDAHGRNFQNSTNGYFDPITKELVMFHDDELTPCEIINLSDPIVSINAEALDPDNRINCQKKEAEADPAIEASEKERVKTNEISHRIPLKNVTHKKTSPSVIKPKLKKHLFKRIGRLIIEHPDTLIKGLKYVGEGIATVASIADAFRDVRGYFINNSSDSDSDHLTVSSLDNQTEETSKTEDSSAKDNESKERISPQLHRVDRHTQKYHTKNGTITKEKEPYWRGKKEND